MQYELVRMQPKFKQDLLVSVAIFQKDVDTYMEQFDSVSNLKTVCGWFSINQCIHINLFFILCLVFQEGPLVVGVAPQEASRRLQIYQVTVSILSVCENL